MTGDEKRYTNEEIWTMFSDDKTLPRDFRGEMLGRMDAMYHAMAMCVLKNRDESMIMADSWGDTWVEEYNRFVTIYQKYINL